MKEEEKLISKIQREYGYQNMMEVLDMLKKINSLMYQDHTKRTENLRELLTYLNTILNGDQISQISTYNSKSSIAKTALESIISSHLQDSIDYKRVVDGEISAAIEKRKAIDTENETLEKQMLELRSKKEELKREYKSLYDEVKEYVSLWQEDTDEKLQQYRKEQENQIEAELEAKRKEAADEKSILLSEIQSLEEEKESLKKLIKEFREEYKKLSGFTSTINGSKSTVNWVEIDENNPIYAVMPCNIEKYISNLKSTYMIETGCSKEVCDAEFTANCAGLSLIKDILVSFSSDFQYYSITALSNVSNFESKYNRNKSWALREALKSIKLPEYVKSKNDFDSLPQIPEENLESVSDLVRNFKYQRALIDAVVKQKTAEAQLQIALNVISRIAPNSINYERLFTQEQLENPMMLDFIKNNNE